MKRIAIAFLTMIMLFSMSACGNEAEEPEVSAEVNEIQSDTITVDSSNKNDVVLDVDGVSLKIVEYVYNPESDTPYGINVLVDNSKSEFEENVNLDISYGTSMDDYIVSDIYFDVGMGEGVPLGKKGTYNITFESPTDSGFNVDGWKKLNTSLILYEGEYVDDPFGVVDLVIDKSCWK